MIKPAPGPLVQDETLCRPAAVRLWVDDFADVEFLAFDLGLDRFILVGVLHHVEGDVEKEIMGLGRQLWMHSLQVASIH